MSHKPFLISTLFMIACTCLLGQDKISVEEYIMTYKETAMDKMEDYGIPASITLAQGILESGIGNSELARKANNHFGIKCHKGWTGKTYKMDDDAKNECFRKYKSPEESYRDHSLFLTSRDRYADLFKLNVTDYKGWARGLKKAGYATNPKYPQLLIRIIEENMLYEFDRGVTPGYLASTNPLPPPVEPQNDHPISIPGPSDYKLIEIWETGRKVYTNNDVKFVFAEDGDTYSDIAADFEIYSCRLPKYNETDKNTPLKAGQMIYIEKKKRKNPETDTHTVISGESMHSISQRYGIQIKQLYRKNKTEEGSAVEAGVVLKLN